MPVNFDQYHPQWGGIYDTIRQQKRLRYRNRHGKWPEEERVYIFQTHPAAQIEQEAADEATAAIRQMRSFDGNDGEG